MSNGDPNLDGELTVQQIVQEEASEIFWTDTDDIDQATSAQRMQWELETEIGIEFGVSLALGRNAFGKAVSGIGLWVDDVKSETEFLQYWASKRETVHQVCHILDEGIRAQHTDLLVKLSGRERECLTYLAIGLRPAEICWKLKISEKTLEKYVRGAKNKLRARTRDHAVAKALVLNIIRP